LGERDEDSILLELEMKFAGKKIDERAFERKL